MSDAIDAFLGQQDSAATSFVQGLDGDSASAERTFQLSKSTGVDPAAIGSDPTAFDDQYKRMLGQHIVGNNPYLTKFVSGNPLHAQLAQDQLADLDSASKAQDRVNDHEDGSMHLLTSTWRGLSEAVFNALQAPEAYTDPKSYLDRQPKDPWRAPESEAWSRADFYPSHWGTLANKLAFTIGSSIPVTAAGILGASGAGAAASETGPGAIPAAATGGLVSASLMAGAMSTMQEMGSSLKEEAQRTPNDLDGAYRRAVERSITSGAFTTAGWSLFGKNLFEGPFKRFLFQVAGVQAPLASGEQVTKNFIDGEDPTKGIGQAYLAGLLGSIIPVGLHEGLGGRAGEGEGKAAPPPPPPDQPDLGRRGFLKGAGAALASKASGLDIFDGIGKLVGGDLQDPRLAWAGNLKEYLEDHFFYNWSEIPGEPPKGVDMIQLIRERQKWYNDAVEREGEESFRKNFTQINGLDDYPGGRNAAYDDAVKLLENGFKPDKASWELRYEAQLLEKFGDPSKIDGINDQVDELRAAQAKGNQEALSEAMSEAEKVPMKANLPEKFEEYLHNENNQTVRIPLAELAKVWKPGENDTIANAIPDIAQRMKNPIGHVEIPLEKYLAHFPKDIHDALQDHVAVGDALSKNEVELLKEARAERKKQAAAAPDWRGEADELGQSIAEQAKAAGHEPESADAVGKLAAQYYLARAHRNRISPKDLFNRYPVRIEGGGERAGEGTTLAQDTGAQAISAAIARMASKTRGGNEWVQVPEGGSGLYLRVGPRGIDVANVDFDQKGTGAFTRYLDQIEREAAARQLPAVRVENILNERLIPFLEKRGYLTEFNPFGGPPSMYKPTEVSLDQKVRGFYSSPLRAVDGVKQEKMSGPDWWNKISKTQGVKKEQLEWMGLEDFLKSGDKKSYTKDEVKKYITQHDIDVHEIHHSQTMTEPARSQWSTLSHIADDIFAGRTNLEDVLTRLPPEMQELASEVISQWDPSDPNFTHHVRDAIFAARDLIEEANQPLTNAVSWQSPGSRYNLPGVPDSARHEIVLTMPDQIQPYATHDTTHYGRQGGGTAIGWVRFHWRTGPDGEKMLVVDEIQSKRHGDASEYGYKSEIDHARAEQLFNEREELRDKLHKASASLSSIRDEIQEEVYREANLPPNLTTRIRDVFAWLMGKDPGTNEYRRMRDEYHSLVDIRQQHDANRLIDMARNEGLPEDVPDSVRSLVNKWFAQEKVLEDANDAFYTAEHEYTQAIGNRAVPDAPFKTTYPELFAKRVLRYAAENGADSIAVRTAAQQEIDTGTRIDLYDKDVPKTWQKFGSGEKVQREQYELEGGKDAGNLHLPTGIGELRDTAVALREEGFRDPSDWLNVIALQMEERRLSFEDLWLTIPPDARSVIEEETGIGVPQGAKEQIEIHRMKINDALRKNVQENDFALMQQRAEEAARGRITFGHGGAVIQLFESHDASTLVHELFHQWIADTFVDAEHSSEAQALRDMMLKALGREPGSVQDWHSLSIDELEQAAKWGEQYLREGETKSTELAGVFEKFKKWLTDIYQSIVSLGKPISAEVRGFFDKMFDVDEKTADFNDELEMVNSLRESWGLNNDIESLDQSPLKEGKAAGITQAEHAKIQRLMAIQAAQDQKWKEAQAAKLARQLNSREYKAALVRAREAAKLDVLSRPEVRVYLDLEGSGAKILASDLSAEQKSALPRKFWSADGEPIQNLADYFGYETGGDLATTLISMTRLAKGIKGGDIADKLIEAEARKSALAETGPTAEQRNEEIADHALGTTQMELLHEKMFMAGLKVGAKVELSAKQAAWGAREDLMSKTFKEARKVQTFLREMGMAGKQVAKSFIYQDWTEGFRQQQRQFIAAQQADVAKGIAKDYARFVKSLKTLREREPAGIDVDHVLWIHDILDKLGVKIGRSREDLDTEISARHIKTLDGFYGKLVGDGTPVQIPDFLRAGASRPLDELDARTALQAINAVKQIAKLGRNAQRVTIQGVKQDLKDVLKKISATIAQYGPALKEQRIGAYRALHTGIASGITVESLMNRLAYGNIWGKDNPMQIIRPLTEAANAESALQREVAKMAAALKDDVPRSKLRETVKNTIWKDPINARQVDGSMDWSKAPLRRMTRANLRAVMLHVGNMDNLQRLAVGHGLEPGDIQAWVNANAVKADWDWAQGVGDIFAHLKGLSDNMYRTMDLQAPENVPVFPITTPYGVYKGWYAPYIHDPEFFTNYIKDRAIDGMFGSAYMPPGTPNGYTLGRTAYRGPANLDLGAVIPRMTAEIHDIVFRPHVVEANKVLLDPQFRNMLSKHVGGEYANQIEPWLTDVARGKNGTLTDAESTLAKFMDFLRTNTMGVLVGLNPRTVEKHTLTAAINSMQEVGYENFAREFGAMWGGHDFDRVQSNWDFALKKSEELQRRHQNYQESVTGGFESQMPTLDSKGPAVDFVKDWRQWVLEKGTKPIALFDLMSAVPTWLAAYRKIMEGRDESYNAYMKAEGIAAPQEGDAKYRADLAVRRAHGSTAVTNRAAIQRGGPMMQFFTSFYNFFSNMFNRQYELAWRARVAAGLNTEKEAQEALGVGAGHIMMGMFAFVLAPAVIEALVSPSPGSKDESWGKWAVKSVIRGESATIPFAREIIPYMLGETTEGGGGLITPLIHNITGAVNDFRKGGGILTREKAGKTIHDFNNLVGSLTGITNNEIGNLLEFTTNLLNGREHPRASLSKWWQGLTKGKSEPKQPRPDLIGRFLGVKQ